eukprot:COSAG01_NODE_44998_length_413_cov_3.133758_1_plen_84_part_01
MPAAGAGTVDTRATAACAAAAAHALPQKGWPEQAGLALQKVQVAAVSCGATVATEWGHAKGCTTGTAGWPANPTPAATGAIYAA